MVYVRVSEEEKKALVAAAHKRGVSLNEWARRVLTATAASTT